MKNKKSEEGEIEKTYQKKTQLEHILLRPDTYIGAIDHISEKLWVFDSKIEKLVYKTITYVPGLYKIFDEILVNAIDNIVRDLSMSSIKVNITKNEISIYNNGKGIPIEIHKKYNIYVPELIFGHLLTSSNYDDSQKKITGGRNGYGAKLTNVFSTKFIVETGSKKQKKKFKMEFTKNMSKHTDPEITKFDDKDENFEDFTRITFEPDFKKFKMTEIDDDIMSLLYKRVYDVAGTTPPRINVELNGKKINVKSFTDYIDLYIKDRYFDEESKVEYPKIIANNNERWDVGFSMTDGTFQQVSFVNGICTSKGGTHVNYIVDQVTDKISDYLKKKYKDIKMNTNQIKQNLWVFIRCNIENPAFDSQTKETLTTKVDKFGSKLTLTDKFLKELLKSNIVNNIIEFAKVKQKIKLHKALSSNIKKSSRLLGIEKLEDANLAGTKDYKDCTLIVTEGDSAKALALAGIEVVGRDKYGVFPLKGKMLNVRSAKDSQIMNNEEIQNIIKILGLKMNMDYKDELKGMRYGHLLIMADQDFDGSHIKGLIINFIHFFWPSLIKRGDFLHEFITPIVKVTKEGQSDKVFFTIKEYNDWYYNNKHNGYKIKYYKGLGTSTSKEAKDYFKNIKKNKIDFYYINDEDDKSIELGFSKLDSEARKNWLLEFDPLNTYIDHSKGVVRYKDFINKELIFFSNYDNIRSIPSLMDGLKPSERKIIYACFKRNLHSELKVAQLSGYVAEHSSYHHGEQSLGSTITALAQDFVGSNNLNYLLPIGQFGSRYNGIKGAASPRYIFTMLNPLTRKVFYENDDILLLYNVDEGMKIEPVWYVPILPTVLINGTDGIGTGWSTSVPQYNPIDIANNLINKMNGEEFKDMIPWYKGFTGTIKENTDNKSGFKSYIITGKINVNLNEECVEITELPIHVWTRDYKTFLEKNHVDNKETDSHNREFEVEDIKEYHTDNRLSFVVKLTDSSFEKIKNLTNEQLIKMFKISSTISTTNMVLFDSNNKIKRYNNVIEILEEFYKIRLDFYYKRKDYLLDKIGFNLDKNKNKRKFINLILSNQIPFKTSKSKTEILKFLKKNELLTLSQLKKKYSKAFHINSTEAIIDNNDSNENIDNNSDDEDDYNYDYLLNMNIWSLTNDKVNELDKDIKKDQEQYDYLNNHSVIDLWKKDLNEFINLYKSVINETGGKDEECRVKIEELKRKSAALRPKKKNKTQKKKKKKNEDSFLESDEDDDSGEMSVEEEDEKYSVYSDEESSNKKNKKSKLKKENEKKSEKDNLIEIDEEKEDKIANTSNKKSSIKKSNKKMEIDEKDKNKLSENLVSKKLMEVLNVSNEKLKEAEKIDDITKLPLRERLAIKAKQGKINVDLQNIKPNNNKNDYDSDILKINTDDEKKEVKFLGNKTKSSTKKSDIKSTKNDSPTKKKKEDSPAKKKKEDSVSKKKKESSTKKNNNKSNSKQKDNKKKKPLRKKKNSDDEDDSDDEDFTV